MQQGNSFIVSPRSVHVATLSHHGSRAVMIYDGVPGPEFDQIFPNAGQGYAVLFSPDGNHWAYCGAVGSQWTVMLDGKPQTTGTDSLNGAVSNRSCSFGFTSNSKHLYYTSTRDFTINHRTPIPGTRFVFDGKSSPTGTSEDIREYAFSPDGNHVAYFVTDLASTAPYPPPPTLMIDFQAVPYTAGLPQWTADSQHLYTSRQVPVPPHQINEYLLDGKPVLRADFARIYVPPVGNMVVIAAQKTSVNPATWFLSIDGKVVPGSEQTGGQIVGLIFSADGKHYAARYGNQNGRQFIFADGKKGREYPGFGNIPADGGKDPGFATFAPVTNKLIYHSYDTTNSQSFLVVDGQESDPIASLFTALVISPTGDRYMTEGGTQFTINGKEIQFPNVNRQSMGTSSLSFTPDGAHYAFVLHTPQGPQIVLDGVIQTAYAPINQGQLKDLSTAPYVFSPDSKHIAYACRSSNPASGNDMYICLDNKAVRIGSSTYNNLTFSADSKHLFWSKIIPQGGMRIFADGKPVVEGFPTAASGSLTPSVWQAGPDNNLLVLLQGDQGLQRVSVTPAPDSSIAAMLGGATELPAAH
jgi:Tol biopolymer transport system component